MQFINHSLSVPGSSQSRLLILYSHDQTIFFSHSLHHFQVFIRGKRDMRFFILSKKMSQEEGDLNISSQNTKKGRVSIDVSICAYSCN